MATSESTVKKHRVKTHAGAIEKVCRNCGVLKPRSEYYRVSRMTDKLNARCKECLKAQAKANRVYIPNRERKWHLAHPEVKRARASAERARKAGAVGRFTGKQLLEKFAFHGWRCYLCQCLLTFKTATIDHRKSIRKGGTNWIANVAPACLRCNMKKARLEESRYRQSSNARTQTPKGRKRACPTCGTLVWERYIREGA